MYDQLEEFIEHGFRKSKSSSIVLVAESELTGGAMHYAERVKNEPLRGFGGTPEFQNGGRLGGVKNGQ